MQRSTHEHRDLRSAYSRNLSSLSAVAALARDSLCSTCSTTCRYPYAATKQLTIEREATIDGFEPTEPVGMGLAAMVVGATILVIRRRRDEEDDEEAEHVLDLKEPEYDPDREKEKAS